MGQTNKVCNGIFQRISNIGLSLLFLSLFIKGDAQSTSCSATFDYSASCGNMFQYTSASSAINLTYKWDFGDGTTSNDKNPSHIYKTNNSYQVILHVTNTDLTCKDSTYKLIYAKNEVRVMGSLHVDPSNRRVYSFENYSEGKNLKCLWDFGDGTTSNRSIGTHFYQNDNAHIATLTVTDSINGCFGIETDTLFSSCDADFTYTSYLLNKFSFQSKSLHYPDKVLWDFGDGSTSTEQIAFHEYASKGTFNVCLTIYPSFCPPMKVCKQIENKATPCKANYTTYEVAGAPSNEVNFHEELMGITEYTKSTWNYGDGSPKEERLNPGHTFIDRGIYNVCLTISDSTTNCASTYCRNIIIAKTDCKPYFGARPDDNDHRTVLLSVSTFTSRSYVWDFGDGTTSTLADPVKHTYTKSGNFTICLTVTDKANECVDTYCQRVKISSCSAEYTYALDAANGVFQFNALASGNDLIYKWVFSDGATSSLKNPTHKFDFDGTHNVLLTVYSTSDATCRDSVVKAIKVDLYKNCKASFTISHDPQSNNPNAYIITNNVTDPRINYFWTYGDGSGWGTSHTYPGNGPYTICVYAVSPDTACRISYCDTIKGDGTDSLKINIVNRPTGIQTNNTDNLFLENYPNPFSGNTTIHYTIKTTSQLEISVFDLLGNKVDLIQSDTKAPGDYTIDWNAHHIRDGMYLLQLKTPDRSITKKIVISR